MSQAKPIAKYIISRSADPVFAVSIGISAALIRIRREENEKRLGLRSSSIVVSPEQQSRLDAERESERAVYQKSSEMHEPSEGASKDSIGTSNFGLVHPQYPDTASVSYADILSLGWERIKWKADYEWNGKGKELERGDGRMV
ncbi:uncharacterized protein KY384_000261 [Bacidia gigantensis]|uniref:uncharacterized protein n=1 Tax=Bacidia gigantensis TaxID=2732470 RepID=UPI001D0534FA|nr:uncharacterized protein KY384_000261 [Bacidia gigantensis]KAG8526268.1 hypothetical protein KY384_000261 [Bacidia gigantensis]